MANNTKKDQEKKTQPSPLIGHQAKAVTLDTTTKLDIDIDKNFLADIIDAGLASKLDISALDNFTTMANSRDQIYQLIDTMMQDSTVSAIVRTYAEDVCEPNDNGHIIWAESEDEKVSKFVNYLLNVMNADKYIFGWAYTLIEYGDLYLRCFRESDYADPLFKRDKIEKAYSARNVLNEDYLKDKAEQLAEDIRLNLHSASDHYSYYVEAIADPSTMFELTKHGISYGYIETPNSETGFNFLDNITMAGATTSTVANYKMKTNDINIYQADDVVHAYLADNYSRFPETVTIFQEEADYEANNVEKSTSYKVRRGKSMLYDSYKIWREKALLESAILLTRVTRSSLIQKVQVEVGDMSKEKAAATLRNVKRLFEQKTSVDPNISMTEYTNPGAIVNYIYLTTHGGQGAVSVESIGGDINIKDLADLDNWTNKFYSSYGIPKQYFGWTDDGAGFNGGSSLTIISSVYAKGVKRIQNALIQAVTDIINLFLIDRGYKSYLNRFVIKMKTPITQEEKDYRASLTDKISAISNMASLFADVDSKSRKLKIMKSLVSTLNYGDDILSYLQDEIDDAETKEEDERIQAELEASQAEAEAEGNMGGGSAEAELPSSDITSEELAPVADESELETESFKRTGNVLLTEDLPDLDVLIEGEDLPTPEELDASKDFTRNTEKEE